MTTAISLVVLLSVTAATFDLRTLLKDALAGSPHEPRAARTDSDGDGLTDTVESRGWRTESGVLRTADPTDIDSDDDGLPDGLEAGHRKTAGRSPTYSGVADPMDADSDDDGLNDADEYFQDMDPEAPDSDGDGLDDIDELDFGSDPTSENSDGDSYTDKEEFEDGLEPMAYNLTKGQQADAAEAGAKYGDCYECALDQGLRDEQVESAFYLAGQTASGVAVYGDVRDLGYNLFKGRFFEAGIAGVGLIPVVGDSTKTVASITKFAARSERGSSIAADFAKRLPKQVREKLPDKLVRRGATLPSQLADGPSDNVVYLWKGTDGCPTYVGITSNFAKRSGQHARNGRCFLPMPIADKLTRGEARAIEEACMLQGGFGTNASTVQNQRHSISTSKDYYEDAVSWGTSYLEKSNVSCK